MNFNDRSLINNSPVNHSIIMICKMYISKYSTKQTKDKKQFKNQIHLYTRHAFV